MKGKLIENIELFLEGKTTRADLEQLAIAAGVQDLDAEIQWVKDAQTAIAAQGLREELATILPKVEKPSAKIVRFRVRTWQWTAAASVLLIIAAFWGYSLRDSGGLYAQYQFIDPGLPVLMSQTEQYELYDALTYFGEGDYKESENKLLVLQADKPDNDTINYFLGASQLYRRQTGPAQINLERVAANPNSAFQAKAQWLMVLTALKAKDRSTAKDRLAPILQDSTHVFYNSALTLAKDLAE